MNDPDVDSHVDYQAPRPSERHQVAWDALGYLRGLGLSQDEAPCRGDKGKCYAVRFARPGKGQGEVQVYSPGYVRVSYATVQGAVPGLAAHGSRLYASVEEALAFLTLSFVALEPDAAALVPEKIPGRKKH